MGTDGAGSIRIPSLCTGIYGFKPTKGRWPIEGHCDVGYFTWNLSLCGGPLTQSIDDMKLFLGSTLNPSTLRKANYSESLVNMDWSDDKFEMHKKSIKKFAYLSQIDKFPLGPANKRALNEVVIKLRDAGYEVEEVNWPQEDIDCILSSFFMNALITQVGRIRSIAGEKAIPEFFITSLMAKSSYFIRKVLSFFLKLSGNQRFANIIDDSIVESNSEYWKRESEKIRAIFKFHSYFLANNFDAMIIPGGNCAAMKHGNGQKLATTWCYTFLSNMMNFPTGSMPVTTVRENEQCVTEDQFKNDILTKDLIENAKDSVGLPIGVQICGMPFLDEKTLAAMKIVDD